MKVMMKRRTNQILLFISIAMILAALIIFALSSNTGVTILDGTVPLSEYPPEMENSHSESLSENGLPFAVEDSEASQEYSNV